MVIHQSSIYIKRQTANIIGQYVPDKNIKEIFYSFSFCPLYSKIGMIEKIIIHWVVPKKKNIPATIEMMTH